MAIGAPAPGLGQDVATATASAFFQWFHLQPGEPARDIGDSHVWHSFRPEAARFQSAVTLNLEVDRAGNIDRLTLCLDRAFLAKPADCPFARDIAKSFLLWALPAVDQQQIMSLIEEIGDVSRCGSIVIRHASMKQPDLPRFPSPGYRTFLGHDGAFDLELLESALRIVNLNWTKRQDEVVTPPGYDGETMWMWLIVRRRL